MISPSSLKDFLIPPKASRKVSRFLFVQSRVFVLSTHSSDFRVPSHTLWSFCDDCVISQLTFNPLHPARTSLFNEIHSLFAYWRIWREKQTVWVQLSRGRWRNLRVLTPFRTHFSWFGEYRWYHSGSSRFMIPFMIRENDQRGFWSTRTFSNPAMWINLNTSSNLANEMKLATKLTRSKYGFVNILDACVSLEVEFVFVSLFLFHSLSHTMTLFILIRIFLWLRRPKLDTRIWSNWHLIRIPSTRYILCGSTPTTLNREKKSL